MQDIRDNASVLNKSDAAILSQCKFSRRLCANVAVAQNPCATVMTEVDL